MRWVQPSGGLTSHTGYRSRNTEASGLPPERVSLPAWALWADGPGNVRAEATGPARRFQTEPVGLPNLSLKAFPPTADKSVNSARTG
jgi:hypothetical protein